MKIIILIALCTFSSLLVSCGFVPERRSTAPITVHVSDRYGKNMQGLAVKQFREVAGWWFLIGTCPKQLSKQVTKPNGTVHFDEVREQDSISATTEDQRFLATDLVTRRSPQLYRLRLDHHTGIETHYSKGFNWSQEPVTSEARSGLIAILDYHQKCGQWNFSSLDHYLAADVISSKQHQALHQVIPLLGSEQTLEYKWGTYSLKLRDDKSSLGWVRQ